MELREIIRIVRRWWWVACIGVVAAIGLGLLTYNHRAATDYTSTATIFVTQQGFQFSSGANAPGGTSSQLANLAYLYSQLVQGDSIRESIGAPIGSISAGVVTSGAFSSGYALPFLNITGKAKSPAAAQTLARAATHALQLYVLQGQNASHTPQSQRPNLSVVNAPMPGQALASRTRVVILPGVVAITVLLATLGLLFMLENLSRPPQDETEGNIDELVGRNRFSRTGAEAETPAVPVEQSSHGGILRRS